MYSTRFDRWVGKVGKLVGKVVENGLLGIFPLEHSFYYRPIQVKSMGCMYLITLCMHVCFRKKCQVRYAIKKEEKNQKEDRKLFKAAINDRVGIYNVSLLSPLSRLLSPPSFSKKDKNQMLPPLPAAAAAAAAAS